MRGAVDVLILRAAAAIKQCGVPGEENTHQGLACSRICRWWSRRPGGDQICYFQLQEPESAWPEPRTRVPHGILHRVLDVVLAVKGIAPNLMRWPQMRPRCRPHGLDAVVRLAPGAVQDPRSRNSRICISTSASWRANDPGVKGAIASAGLPLSTESRASTKCA